MDKAVKAARATFQLGSPWCSKDISDRGQLLYRLADLMEWNQTYLVALETLDNGKPYAISDLMDLDMVLKCFWAGQISTMEKQFPWMETSLATPTM